MIQLSEEKQIEYGERVGRFLDDEAVKLAFEEVERKCFQQFRESKTPQEREQLHARVSALFALAEELKAIYNQGVRARFERDQREKREGQKKPNRRN